MKVDWDKFNDKYHEQISIAKIDCTESKNVCAQYGVSAYPMLLYIDQTLRWYSYEKEVNIDKLADFVLKEEYKTVQEQGEPNQFTLKTIAREMAKQIDRQFEHYGLEAIPHFVRYTIYISTALIPLVMALSLSCCDSSEK